MLRTVAVLLGAWLLATPAVAQTVKVLRPDQATFRGLYKELVETDTTQGTGSCTLAAERMAARLKSAGLRDDHVTLYSTTDHPKDGGLVAVWPGTSKTLRPMLLIAHIDVVAAKREDWVRDPFTLIEEDGFFYARGSMDDKAQAAIWTDLLMRFAKDGYRPKRTIKLALSCGEETNGAFNGIEWLIANRRKLIDAELSRPQCIAAAGTGQHQLPDLSGPFG